MKNNINRLLCLLIAAVMALTLTACGNKEPADPNLVKIDDYTVLYKGASIMTDDEGNDAVVLTLDYTNNSKEDAAFWVAVFEKAMQDGIQLDTALVYPDPDSFASITDDKFTDVAPGKTFEVHTSFVLRDATSPVEVTFSDLFEKYKGTITIDPSTLTREGAEPEPSDAETDGPMTAVPTGDALLDWWNGDWYGWWAITGGDGEYEDWSNQWWDCCANISIGADYTGKVIIWDEDLPQDNAISEANVTLSAIGTGEYGTLTSEDGYFLDGELAHADWIVDPGLMDYDNLICIDGWYEDENGSFHYAMYLRPWGTLWDDIAADDPDNLPYYYESWYLPLVEAGAKMPDVIGGDYGGLAPGEVPDSQMEPQGGNDPNASAVDGTWQAPVYGDYGLSKASATGVVPMTRDELVDRIGFYADSQIGSAPYDSLYNSMGYIHGKPLIDDPRWDTGKTHVYQWSIESGEYATLVFEVTDYSIGIEKLQSVETSPGLLDG